MTILHDLKVAARSLLARPALSLGVVLTLALGIGATATIFSVVDGVVLRPLPYQDAARLVTLGSIPRRRKGSIQRPGCRTWSA